LVKVEMATTTTTTTTTTTAAAAIAETGLLKPGKRAIVAKTPVAASTDSAVIP
jgi:hypothetical protein